jgi:lysozyme family protein
LAATNYLACLKKMLVYEGGYSNHPSDPGGVTLEGVIQTRYNEYRRAKGLPQKALTPQMRGTPEWTAERNEIYRKYYWDAVRGDSLAKGVDLVVFDFGVNSGPSRALRYLNGCLGGSAVDTVKRLCDARLSFLHNLGTWGVFGKGWGRRVADVKATGVKMALEGENLPEAEIEKRLTNEARAAKKSAANNGRAAGGTVAAPASTQAPDTPIHVDVTSFDLSTKIGLALLCLALAGAALYFTRKWWLKRIEAEAYLALVSKWKDKAKRVTAVLAE